MSFEQYSRIHVGLQHRGFFFDRRFCLHSCMSYYFARFHFFFFFFDNSMTLTLLFLLALVYPFHIEDALVNKSEHRVCMKLSIS